MEQNNSVTGQQVADQSGVGSSQNQGGYNYQEAAGVSGAGASVAAAANAAGGAGFGADFDNGAGFGGGASGFGVQFDVGAGFGADFAGFDADFAGPAFSGYFGGDAGFGGSSGFDADFEVGATAGAGVVSGAAVTASAGATAAGAATGGGAGDGAGPSSQSASWRNWGYHRHSQQQINAMEALFRDYPHPNKMQRIELARTLGLDLAQVNFWFQNKRTHLKAQSDHIKNQALRRENGVLHTTKQQCMEALRDITCLACGAAGNRLRVEENLRVENIGLRKEVERLKSQVARFMVGQNLQNLPIMFQIPQTSISNVPTSNEFMHSICKLVVSAALELKAMAMAAEPLWIPSSADGITSLLNEFEYLATFPDNFGPTRPGYTCEASRHISRVLLKPKQLLNVLLDVNEWSYMFSPIVSRALTLDVLNVGVEYTAALQVMGAEYYIPTPMVSNREACFARYCTQFEEGLWAVVDVSMDNILPALEIMTCQRRPSGCLIQEMPDGTSKITWIEHVYVDNNGVSTMYKSLLHSGLGFGAKRWVSTLERQCQRLATANILPTVPSPHDFNNLLISSPEGKKGILKLAERMVNNFNFGIIGPKAGKWTKLHQYTGDDDIRLMSTRVMDDPGLLSGTLISVATSFALSLAPSMVFDFFRDHRSRKEWDILAKGNDYEPVFLLSYGEKASNCVSIYKVPWESRGHMLRLQESWSDEVASHIVFATTEIQTINMILSGGDPNSLPILPSGFTILPDGPSQSSCGTLLTVSFQVLINTPSMADINLVDANKIIKFVRHSCQKIKHALDAGGPYI